MPDLYTELHPSREGERSGSNFEVCFLTLRVMRTVVYGVSVYDWPSIAAVVAIFRLITLMATTVPTLRIAAIDPAKTLRDE